MAVLCLGCSFVFVRYPIHNEISLCVMASNSNFMSLSLAKLAIACGSGLVVSLVAWKLYKYNKKMEAFNKDEGFEDVPKDEEPTERKVLVLGLDNSGKSSLLQCLSYEQELSEPAPTQGFNVLCLDKEVPPVAIWEIGGAVNMRKYWNNFIQDTCVLVYVVDSEDQTRHPESYEELHKVLGDDRLKGVPIVMVANKQDKLDAVSPQQVLHFMALDNVSPKQQKVQVIGTAATLAGQKEGIDEFRHLLLSLTR